MVLLLGGYSLWCNRHHRLPLAAFSWREVGAALWAAKWELPLPLVVLGGIYGGYLRRLRGGGGDRRLRAGGRGADLAGDSRCASCRG